LTEEPKNVFVIAPTKLHFEELKTVRGVGDRFHLIPLLDVADVVHVEELRLRHVVDKARAQLDAFGGSVDAIIAHWDFPTTLLAPMLSHERGCRAPSVDAVVQCGHKYWSRVAQRRALGDETPRFALVDPFDPRAIEGTPLPYPFWLKPVKAFSSQLGFRVEDRAGFERALTEIRAAIPRIARPYDELVKEAGVSEELRAIGGQYCLAEEYLGGFEIAHEGRVFRGEVTFHATMDMIREDEVFTRFEWPSSQPARIHRRMEEMTAAVLKEVGYDDGCFNAEYFWDRETDALRLIEINPRISQSHAPLAMLVDGQSIHEVAIDVALGAPPSFEPGAGEHAMAAKLLHRVRRDGVVRRVPTDEELAALERRFGAFIEVTPSEGDRLSDLLDQDAYSYVLASVYMGADSREELLTRYRALLDALPLEVEHREAA